jgi:hypothetical protein
MQSVAECLAKHWRNDMNDHKEKWSILPVLADVVPQAELVTVTAQPKTENKVAQSNAPATVSPSAATLNPQPESLVDVARRLREQKKQDQPKPKPQR